MGLREQKKRDTHDALAQVTVALSCAHGFEAVSVERIVEAAGVSRRTFFRYFPTKEAAFFAEHEQRLARFEAALSRGRAGEGAYARVRRCLLALAEEYDRLRPEMVARHHAIEASPALLAHELQIDRHYEDAIVAALVDDPCDEDALVRARVTGSALFGVVRAVLRPWFEDPSRSLLDRGRQALGFLEQGLGLQPDATLLAEEAP